MAGLLKNLFGLGAGVAATAVGISPFQIKAGHPHSQHNNAFAGYVDLLEKSGRSEAQIKKKLEAVRREAEEAAGV